MEGGTLRNLINCHNISESSSASGHVNEIEDFLELTIKSHLIATALHFFAMTTIDDEPHSNCFPAHISFEKKKNYFMKNYYTLLTVMLYQVGFVQNKRNQLKSLSMTYPTTLI